MEICYVSPVQRSGSPEGAAELARRRAILQAAAFVGTEISIVDVAEGPSSIESAYEEYLGVPAALRIIQDLEARGTDAAIMGCFGDPGVDAARELVHMPVVGCGEASLLLAASLGHRIGIVTILDSIVQPLRRLAWSTGVLEKLASVRTVGIPVEELGEDPDLTFGRMIEVGRACLEQDRADTLVLGCMTMAFAGRHVELAAALGVPVVNPAHAGLKLAETLVSAGLRHSKRAYPVPPKLAAPRPVVAAASRPS